MLDSVQNLYGRQINVVLINETKNGDKLDKIKLKMDDAIGRKMQSIYADSLLGMAFPHQLLPHYVWISEKGTILAITGADFMQMPVIELLLKERAIRQKKR